MAQVIHVVASLIEAPSAATGLPLSNTPPPGNYTPLFLPHSGGHMQIGSYFVVGKPLILLISKCRPGPGESTSGPAGPAYDPPQAWVCVDQRVHLRYT